MGHSIRGYVVITGSRGVEREGPGRCLVVGDRAIAEIDGQSLAVRGRDLRAASTDGSTLRILHVDEQGVEREISVTGESDALRAAAARLREIVHEAAVGGVVFGPINAWFVDPAAHAFMVNPPHGALVRATWALDRIVGPGSFPDWSQSVASFEATRGACDGWAGRPCGRGSVRLRLMAADEVVELCDACFWFPHRGVAATATAWLAERGGEVAAPTVHRELIESVDPQQAWLPTHSEIDWAIRAAVATAT